MLGRLRDRFTNFMQLRALQQHGSRVGWRIAPRYTRYLKVCQAGFSGKLPPAGELSQAVAEFQRDGITSFWTTETAAIANGIYRKLQEREAAGAHLWGELGASGNRNYQGNAYLDFPELEGLFRGPLGTFLLNHYRTYFKIFYASMLKSVRIGDVPGGSQLWHSDSGPGTCVIVAFYLHDVLDENAGVLHALPWKQSIEIYRREHEELSRMARQRGINLRTANRENRRELMTTYYRDVIDANYSDAVRGPKGKAGLVVPFLNNILHYGGNPAINHERVALLIHCYPSDRPADFDFYNRNGIPKAAPYPIDPAAHF